MAIEQMASITLNKQQKSSLCNALQAYCADELDVELGQFDAEFLLDFISKHFGAYYYNQGLYDAQRLLAEKLSDTSEALLQLEQPVA